MKVETVELTARVRHLEDLPREPLPHIAVAGRSNVGKSTLLNHLFGGKKLAPTSQTPGKTTSLDFFRINHRFFFVDFPGYGYAKKPADLREHWKRLIEDYLKTSTQLFGLLHLVDIRRTFKDMDFQLSEWLRTLDIPEIIIATKCDKLSGSQRGKELRTIQDQAGATPVIPFSINDRQGKTQILKALDAMLEA